MVFMVIAFLLAGAGAFTYFSRDNISPDVQTKEPISFSVKENYEKRKQQKRDELTVKPEAAMKAPSSVKNVERMFK